MEGAENLFQSLLINVPQFIISHWQNKVINNMIGNFLKIEIIIKVMQLITKMYVMFTVLAIIST